MTLKVEEINKNETYNGPVNIRYVRWMSTKDRVREDINRRAINKTYFCKTSYGGWYGEVVDVKDVDTFLVKNSHGRIYPVNIFDLRNPEYFD